IAYASNRLAAHAPSGSSEAQSVLSPLIDSCGVSGAEGPVRELVKRLLPAWAKSETDTAGNLWVRLGQGNPLIVFVAHMDEIGFRVTAVRDDGSLELEPRGRSIASLVAAQRAPRPTAQGHA